MVPLPLVPVRSRSVNAHPLNRLMPKRSVAAGILLIHSVLSGCTGEVPETAPGPPTLEYGARVRVASDRLGPGWHPAVVGTVGECVSLMVLEEGPTPSFSGVRYESLTALEVSSLFPGGEEQQQYQVGADTAGEEWRPQDVDEVRARYGGCLPF